MCVQTLPSIYCQICPEGKFIETKMSKTSIKCEPSKICEIFRDVDAKISHLEPKKVISLLCVFSTYIHTACPIWLFLLVFGPFFAILGDEYG